MRTNRDDLLGDDGTNRPSTLAPLFRGPLSITTLSVMDHADGSLLSRSKRKFLSR
jgi:hypothetical protein